MEEERIRTQLAKTGGTLFFLKDLEISMDQDAFLPMQQLNSLRRAALDGLRREIATTFYRECNPSTTQVETFKEETGNGNRVVWRRAIKTGMEWRYKTIIMRFWKNAQGGQRYFIKRAIIT